RAPTDNDRLATMIGSYELGDPIATRGVGVPGPASAERWFTAGLHRLQHRVQQVSVEADGLRVVERVAPAAHFAAVIVSYHWRWDEQGLRLAVDAGPTGAWGITWGRAGVRFTLPGAYSEASWFGTGPTENYPDSRTAARVGRYASSVDALAAGYARPQETGHRADLRSLLVTGEGQPGFTVVCEGETRPGFTLTRHTAQQLSGAAHPHELPASESTFLYLDAAQHGLGSRSCGPDVRPEYALWPRAVQFTVRLAAG
ncbi:MAG: beta-galactosidase small subunit, partial [Micropruina sp.]